VVGRETELDGVWAPTLAAIHPYGGSWRGLAPEAGNDKYP